MFTFATLLLPAALVAAPDCGPVIDALEKAWKQERLAQYNVESRDQKLTGKPMIVRIGTAEYLSYGAFVQKSESPATNSILASLRRAEKDGSARCEAQGSETIRGTAATKIQFDNPAATKELNPTTMWIAKATGLPVYHEITGFGGFAWVYGSDVKDPAMKK